MNEKPGDVFSRMKNAHTRSWLTFVTLSLLASTPFASTVFAQTRKSPRMISTRSALAIVNGVVRDASGAPLEGVAISLVRAGLNFNGASRVVKETRSRADGTFSVQAAPGRYEVQAQANGFDAAIQNVQLDDAQSLAVRFNLERAGRGRTTPETRIDRDDPKWRIRASQSQRSIFQVDENQSTIIVSGEVASDDSQDGDADTNDAVSDEVAVADDAEENEAQRESINRRPHGVIETYYAASANPNLPFARGVNLAFAMPIDERTNLTVSGQIGSAGITERIEAATRTRLNHRHNLRLGVGAARFVLPDFLNLDSNAAPLSHLAQISLRGADEWIVRDGIVVLFGVDYTQLVGKSRAHRVSPRFGVRFDANARTRVHAAYAPAEEQDETQSSIAFEEQIVTFKQPTAAHITDADGAAQLERTQRLEFGIERVLDNRSSVAATAFFDTTADRAVGLLSLPASAFRGDGGAELTNIVGQQGATRGVRVLLSRRINKAISVAAGYSFGQGQSLNTVALSALRNGDDADADIFRNEFFQTLAAQMDADVTDTTNVQAVVRFSPRATVFAIDPFAGRLAVYDPSLSIIITQELPTFGLPVRARAIVDARNLFDFTVGADDAETTTLVGAMRRSVRGGIAVRF